MYALDVEFGTTAQLFHPGHLLYSFLFRELIVLLHVFGGSGRALFLMQSVNAWIGALAVGFLAVTLSDRFGRVRGVLLSSLFGLSQVFWAEAIDPGCYALAGLAAVGVLNLLMRAREGNAWGIGFLHGFLILFHQLLILAIPAFWMAFAFGDAPRRLRGIRYTAGVLLGAGIPYAIIAARYHPGPLSEKLNWFLIPAGSPMSVGVLQGFWWNWAWAANLKPFWELLVQSVIAQSFWGYVIVSFLVLCILAGTCRHVVCRSPLRPELAVAWAWILPVGVFLFFFHHALRFYILLLPPVLYLIAALSGGCRNQAWGILSAVGLFLLGAVNYSHAIVPRRSGGTQQARILWIHDHVRPIDFLLFAGRGPHSIVNVYAAYFLPQIPARSLYGYLLTQFGRPDTHLDPLTADCEAAWRRGGRVWVEKDLLDLESQKEAETQMKVTPGSVVRWFQKFKKGKEAPGPEGYYLVELKPAFQAR